MDLLCQSMCIYLFVLSLSISSQPNIYVYILLTGQSVDNNFQLCWKLFLDSLLFHCSGRILHLSIMENEQCKARTYYLSVSEITYSLLICSICWWQVPHTTFLLTHVCFLFYHVASNMTLRRLRHFLADTPEKIRWTAEAAWILALAYFIAYLETLAISNVCCNKPFYWVFFNFCCYLAKHLLSKLSCFFCVMEPQIL
jgi:hypothetical protein